MARLTDGCPKCGASAVEPRRFYIVKHWILALITCGLWTPVLIYQLFRSTPVRCAVCKTPLS